MRVINIDDVMDVTEEGLLFVDSSGVAHKILFDECRKNWVAHVNEGDFVDWEGHPIHITFEESRCIGESNRVGDLPYILLYSDDKLKIETKSNNYKKMTKIQKELLAVLYNIGKFTIFDMT